jgi:hypothetical protein
MDDQDQRDVEQGAVFTDVRGQLVVLKDQGHLPNVNFGDDDDSRRFVAEVRRLNRHWKLGQIARVPPPRIRGCLAAR